MMEAGYQAQLRALEPYWIRVGPDRRAVVYQKTGAGDPPRNA
jgi:hypothetical protein